MKKNGFTLMELLIVIAIIVILVAVSIPVFEAQLEKSREAVDLDNIRNACAEMNMALMDDKYDKSKFEKYTASYGTRYMKTYVNCISTKTGWQTKSSQSNGKTMIICGAILNAPTSNKPAVRIRLNLDTGDYDFNPENADPNNKRIGVYNR